MKIKKIKSQRFNVVEVALAIAVMSLALTAFFALYPLGNRALKEIRDDAQIHSCVDMVDSCMKVSLKKGEIVPLSLKDSQALVAWNSKDVWGLFDDENRTRNWDPLVEDVDQNVILYQANCDCSGGKLFRYNSYTEVTVEGERNQVIDFSAEVWADVWSSGLDAQCQIPLIISWPASLPPERRSYKFVSNHIFCPTDVNR